MKTDIILKNWKAEIKKKNIFFILNNDRITFNKKLQFYQNYWRKSSGTLLYWFAQLYNIKHCMTLNRNYSIKTYTYKNKFYTRGTIYGIRISSLAKNSLSWLAKMIELKKLLIIWVT